MRLPLLLLFISFLITIYAQSPFDGFLHFSEVVEVNQSCIGEVVKGKFYFKSGYDKGTELKNFKLENKIFELSINDSLVDPGKSIHLKNMDVMIVNISFQIDSVKPFSTFEFETNHKNYKNNQIILQHASYNVLSEQIQNCESVILNCSEACVDSVRIYFPYGGTISSVNLYKNKFSKEPLHYTSYSMDDGKNYISLHKNEVKSYFVRYGSCHWGNDFWLKLK